MNKLRIYLLLAILIVGLIPDPEGLSKEHMGCRDYDSILINVRWEWDRCAIAPQNTIFINVPGYLTSHIEHRIYGMSLADELLPHISLAYLDGYAWGGISQPDLWREETWRLPSLLYQLYPELHHIERSQ